MMKSLLLMPLLCVALSACQATKPQNVCDGWGRLSPSLDTSVTILRKDRPFANQVAAHNEFGASKGCWK